MSNDHDLADTAAAILFEKAELRLSTLLAEHDALDAGQLPEAVSREIFLGAPSSRQLLRISPAPISKR